MRILFIGHNGYGYPHTRVRCYHFARMLATYPDMETAVLSFRDDLAPHKTEAAMYENLRDREKLLLTGKAVLRLLQEKSTLLYIQKAHFHAAAPFLLHRLGFFPTYFLDYDDYDIPLSNFFGRGIWNRLFFGSNRWDEITFRLARRARGCIAASYELVELLKKENPRVAYISTGVDPDIFAPPPTPEVHEHLTFFWNGLIWGKPILDNVLLMLRAFQQVYSMVPHSRLLIVGGGADWHRLKAQVNTEFASLPIELREWVAPQAMPQILREVDIALLPFAGDDLWIRSKSPTKLFEYMATGLPVVASAVGEVTQVMEHGQSGYLAHQESDFAEGMATLVRNPALRKELGLRARELAIKRYSLPVLGKYLYLFLKECMNE